jgi:uncharacterized protein YbbC (DUF1343 family)
MGELAHFYNKQCLAGKARVTIVPLKNYTRTDDVSDMLVASISPNIMHKQSVFH